MGRARVPGQRRGRCELRVEFGELYGVGARGARPAVQRVFDDECAWHQRRTAAIDGDRVWASLDVVRTDTAPAEPARSDRDLAAVPAVHRRARRSGVTARAECVFASGHDAR